MHKKSKKHYKILHITPYLEGGGAETHIRLISKGMVERGHQVAIYFMKGSDSTKKELEKTGIKIIKGSPGVRGIAKLIAFIKQYKPDFVHAHLYKGEIYGTFVKWLYGKKLKFKLIILRHVDFWPYKPRKLWEFFQKYVFYPTADKVVGISYAVKNFIRDEMGYNLKNVVVIHYGIPLNPPPSSPKYRIHKNRPTLGFAGRLTYQKGLDVLIRALKILDNTSHKLDVLIAGSGELYNFLNNLKDSFINVNLVLLGYVKDIHNFYESIDVFVFPTRFEGFGLVVLEAMLHNKIVIASKISSIPEVVGDAGILISKESPEELSKAIETFLRMSEKEKKKLMQKIKKQCKKFDIEIMLNKYEELYNNLLKR
ncbi:MAG: glycosyltransferase family 4 protein [Candidatus Nanohaloarchaeota archaeon]|nr:glycosyltransferase family 4 protein [Candidatus Nanohaloarchaeota archaeon]